MTRSRIALCLLALAAGFFLLGATAKAEMRHNDAMELARGAAFSRAMDVSLSREFLWAATFTDVRKPQPTKITARRVCFRYRFTIAIDGQRAYDERGHGCASDRRQHVTPVRTLRPYSGFRSAP